MFIFRSSFITAALAFVLAVICQCTLVSAAPSPDRFLMHAYDIDVSSSDAAVATPVAATPSADVASVAAEPSAIPDVPTGDLSATTEPDKQSNGAFSTSAGFGVALLVSSIGVAIQVL